MTERLRIFVVAGEASGDALGGSLMHALLLQYPEIDFHGVGGEKMEREGLQSLFPMEELSVMGVAEVLPKLFPILSRMKQTVKAILEFKPHALITIDSPDFCFRVIKKVKAQTQDIPCIHYVAPSVWAWRPGRAKKVAKFLDHLLTLLPFEPPYFEKHGLRATFVGHPLVEQVDDAGDGEKFMREHGLSPDQPVLCMLPGSRQSELDKLLPRFTKTARRILTAQPEALVVVPTLPHLKNYIEEYFLGRGINPIVIDNVDEKLDCFAASTVAVAASGTVSLELALTKTPHIVAYRLGIISTWIAGLLIKTPYINLVNIILNRAVVPEMLLEKCEPKPMAREVLNLMMVSKAREAQLSSFREALVQLGLGEAETPGYKAARTVLHVIGVEGRGESKAA